jgi:hypothetical protein
MVRPLRRQRHPDPEVVVSKHAIDRNAWSPEEREEYEALLAEIVEATKDTTDRLDLFEHKLLDAVQAHRPWASEVERACRRFGMGKEIARFEARNRALVSHDGRVLSLPAVQARKSVSASGEVSFQRELIQLWTWDEITAKRTEALKAQRTYSDKVAHYDRLLALKVLAPDSTTPSDAADQLGLDIDEFLAKAA